MAEAKKLKILYVITKSNWGGAQRYVYELATSFAQSHDVTVALGGTGEPGASSGLLADRLKDPIYPNGRSAINVKFIRAFARDISLGKELLALKELRTLLRKNEYDVVHLNSSKAGGLGALAARLTRVPQIIFTVHGFPHNEDRNIIARGVIWIATWFTFLLCHSVIVISQYDLERARKFPFCSRKINLVYNSVTPVTQFMNREEAQRKLGVKVASDTLVIGTIAELTKNKGIGYLIQAFAALNRAHPNTILCIVGDGEEKKKLQKMARTENLSETVFFSGFVPHASIYLKAFDIFILPSIKEGLPYVLLEAGFASLPVIATNVGGTPEIIENQKSGSLVSPKVSQELKSAMTSMIEHPEMRSVFGNALKERVITKFSLHEMFSQTKKLYEIEKHRG